MLGKPGHIAKFKSGQSVVVILRDHYGQTKDDFAKNAQYNAKIGIVSSSHQRGSEYIYFIKMSDGVTLQMTEDCLSTA
jgi:hypothetical protein